MVDMLCVYMVGGERTGDIGGWHGGDVVLIK